MWNSVVYDEDKSGPCSRSKHSVTLLGNQLYILAGRNGNVPLKDFWRFDLATNKWELLKPSGDCPPSLQEHTAVPFRDNIYVFGGELGFSAGNETPLWVYESKKNTWRKMRGQKGASVPKGRRGHTTLVHRGSALTYGGYCDLRGSSNELWIFHFDTESWHLLMNAKNGPAARHKHSSVLHDDSMWIYGGMTDLQERSDLWRFDLSTKTWFAVKCKFSPGPLHSHAACKLPSSMLLFGGERNGQLINELWRFHFGTETWQRIRTDVISPQPISECCAVTVPELLFRNEASNVKIDVRNNYPSMVRREYHCSSEIAGGDLNGAYNNNIHSNGYGNGNGNGNGNNGSSAYSYYPSYVSRSSGSGYGGGGVSNGEGLMVPPRRQATTPNSCNLSFLKEISKISQMNLSRLTQNARCSYHALGSNESINNGDDVGVAAEMEAETEFQTSTSTSNSNSNDEFNRSMARSRLSGSGRWSAGSCHLRDVCSLVNTPLTPSDAAKLVYLEGEEAPVLPTIADEFSAVHQRLHPSQNRNRRSYPLTNSVRFANPLVVTPEQPSPDITSDYASCENIHKLLSSNNRINSAAAAATATTTTVCDRIKTPPNNKDCSAISFSNPNYFTNTLISPSTSTAATLTSALQQQQQQQKQQMGYVEEKICRGDYVKLNSPADSLLEDSSSLDNKYEMTELRPKPPKSLPLRCAAGVGAADMPTARRKKYRACSAGRYENQSITSLCVFLIGGKDHCQITTFKRPISVWRLSLTEDIY